MKPKVLISGYYGFDNFGDEAILSLLIQNLEAEGCFVHVLSRNPKRTSLFQAVSASQSFSIINLFKRISACDILMSGGGSLLQDATSVKSLIYYLFVILLAQVFKKRVVIFAQGIGPIKNKLLFQFTVGLLKKCEYISVRDEKSLFLLRGLGLVPKLVNDPVFSINVGNQPKKNLVGVQLRDWKHLNDAFILALSKSVAQNFPDKEIVVYSLQESLDHDVCKKFSNYLQLQNPKQKISFVSGQTNEFVVQSLSTLEYLISMRFHAILVGLKAGVKILALNYDEKVEKLARESNIPYINFDKAEQLNLRIEQMKSLNAAELANWARSVEFNFDDLNDYIKNNEKR